MTRLALPAVALTLALSLAGSQPAQAWASCAALNGTQCDPYWDYPCTGDDNQTYECFCRNGRLLCPL